MDSLDLVSTFSDSYDLFPNDDPFSLFVGNRRSGVVTCRILVLPSHCWMMTNRWRPSLFLIPRHPGITTTCGWIRWGFLPLGTSSLTRKILHTAQLQPHPRWTLIIVEYCLPPIIRRILHVSPLCSVQTNWRVINPTNCLLSLVLHPWLWLMSRPPGLPLWRRAYQDCRAALSFDDVIIFFFYFFSGQSEEGENPFYLPVLHLWS